MNASYGSWFHNIAEETRIWTSQILDHDQNTIQIGAKIKVESPGP